ncbi:MAG: polysaccharide deacetylase family protein [Acidobacteriota bacterium]
MSSQLLILGLHRVGYPPNNAKIRGLFISPRLLSFQLSLLKLLGYRFLTLCDAIAHSDRNEKVAVLTFDDGYADITGALPVLKKFNAPATVFVITADVGKKVVVWNEAGEDLPADILDWDELSALRDDGWEIASHAHEHVHLARYDERKQEEIIGRSIAEIEKNLGERPVSFAYPYGSFDKTTKRVLKRNGIKLAVTIEPAKFDDDLVARDYLELSRLSLGGRRFYHYGKAFLKTMKATAVFAPLRSFRAHRVVPRIND